MQAEKGKRYKLNKRGISANPCQTVEVICERKNVETKDVELEINRREDNGYLAYNIYVNGELVGSCSGCIRDEHLNLTSKGTMQKLTSMLKRLLDADAQTLYKAGFINGDLELTDEGEKALSGLLFDANKADMVKLAQESLDEEKE